MSFEYLLTLFVHLYHFFLAAPHNLPDASPPTRDWTQSLDSKSEEYQPLDHQGIS